MPGGGGKGRAGEGEEICLQAYDIGVLQLCQAADGLGVLLEGGIQAGNVPGEYLEGRHILAQRGPSALVVDRSCGRLCGLYLLLGGLPLLGLWLGGFRGFCLVF